MVGGGLVKSYLRTRIARLVPSMRRLTHLSLVSSLHLSSINTYLSSPDSGPSRSPRRSLAGVPPGGSPFFLGNYAHSEKVCSSPREKGRAAQAAPLIP